MINLPVRKIRTLVCLAETRSFGRTALMLNISQPAVSAHIRELEEMLGVALVHRTTRSVALTQEGEAFAARAGRALGDLETAARDLHDISTAHRGQVFVACTPPLMSALVPGVIRELSSSYPEVHVQLTDVRSTRLDSFVRSGEVDFGLGPRPISGNIVFEHLYRDHFLAAVCYDHELATHMDVSLRELLNYPFIASSRDTNARQVLDRAAMRLRKPLEPRFELVHYNSVGRFVEAGLGVAILPQTAFPGINSGKLVALPIRSHQIYRDIGLIRRREYAPSPAAAAFIEVLKKAISSGAMELKLLGSGPIKRVYDSVAG